MSCPYCRPVTLVTRAVENVPDGLPPTARLHSSSYKPSRIYHLSPAGDPELRSRTASDHDRAHPTNVALKGDKVCTADLRRWHITELDHSDA
ncbi:MAG TPA: hypothetical protein VGX71_16390 [Pseudaminobacter sp.]|nr:hypothetical protein [Pseudaminobacter sp.]